MKEPLSDKKQAFLLYTLFCGDSTKTAHALGCSVLAVAKLAEEGNWDEKVGEIASLRKSDRPGDLERAINRAINYTDAHRYRLQLQRVLEYFQGLPEEQLEDLLITERFDKEGNVVGRSLSTRPFADLSAALEKAHALTYLALGDTAQDRARRKEESDDGVMAATVMNQQIIDAMAEQGQLEAPSDQLQEAQAKRAQEIALEEASLEKQSPEQPDSPSQFDIPPITTRKRRVKMRKGRTKKR
jgi:hypothetical protein